MNLLLPLLSRNLTRSFLLLFCSILFKYTPAAAQITGKALAFNALTINDGLSQGMVTCIFQDQYGFMWFATLDGLNRYDGYNFVAYRHNAQDPTSITESFAQTLFEDSKGRLWIGTISGGLDLFDRETETFIHLKHQDDNRASLSGGPINSIAEDEQGNIWVQVSEKLDKITITKKENDFHEHFLIRHVQVPFQSENSFLSVSRSGKIYYAEADESVVYKFEQAGPGKWSVALNLNDYFKKQNVDIKSKFRIVQLLQDTLQGKLYVFHEGGVVCYNERMGTMAQLFRNNFLKKQERPLRACLDRNGIAWFTNHDRLFCFNTFSGQLDYVTASDSAFSWPAGHSYTAFIDRSGLLWVGTSGYGILKRNIRAETFHHTGNSSLYAIREASNGKILFGRDIPNGKIYDREKGELIDAVALIKSKADAEYYARFFNLPIVTDAAGAWFSDRNTLRYVNENKKESIDYQLPLPYNDDYPDFIQCRITDSSGAIWLGTTEGLLRFNVTERRWTVYQNKLNDPSSLSSKRIFSLCLDPGQPKKYLWIGTDGGGLNRMEIATGKCIIYTVKDGLPNNVIYGILHGDDNNLWLSTNKGLSCFNPQKQTFRNFNYKDGLQSNEFNRRSFYQTKDSCLFFGGVNGFNYFYPREILNNKTVPQIVITGLKIHNQPVLVQPKGSPLTKAIYLTKKLALPYQQNFVSFEFASLDFTNPEENQYQYKLQGFDKDWIHSGNIHSATYTNLDPGTYSFMVKGSNSDDVWNDRETSIQLIILPPWYMTWWFRTAIAVIVLLIAYSFYRYRLLQALKLQAIRDRIAGDLHDEVGSNLSNIYIFSNVAQQKITADNETSLLLQKITEYTRQSMEAMNDIVWMINTRNDRFENIMVRMRTIAAEFFEASGCSLHLDFDESLNDVKLNMEERKNFYLIYKEAINNTAKYAQCKSLWVGMKLNHNLVTLKIRDNGKGFDTVKMHNGNGMYNMQKRAQMLNGALTVTSTIGEGTTVQLIFKV